jgi:hypothetical protein
VTTATVPDLPDLATLADEQRALRARLAQLRRRLRLELLLEFGVDAAAALVLTAATLVALDWWFRPGLPVRLVLLALCAAGLLAFLGVRAARRVRSARLDGLSLAVALDRFRPGTGQHVADVLQLPDLLDEPGSSASPVLVRLAVRRATEALAGSDWRSLWNRKRTALFASALVASALVPVAFAALAPDAARLSVARWLLGSSERWPQRTYLTVTGLDDRGRLIAPRDERYSVEVRSDLATLQSRGGRWVVGGRGEPLALRRKPLAAKPPRSVLVRERTAEGARRDGVMVATGPARFRYEFPASPSSSTFDLTGGDDWLGPVRIERVDRPALAATRLRVREPGATYSGFRAVDDARQHLTFLPDTQVELTLVGSEPLAEAKLTAHPGSLPRPARVDGRTFAVAWTLREATTLEILLTSTTTGLASRPAFVSLGLLRDREPRVTLRAVGVGVHVTPVATIPLSAAATDDLGLAALRLRAERTVSTGENSPPKTDRKVENLPLPAEPGRPVLDHQVRRDVVLQTDPPKPGTILKFTAEADDRCARGAQTGRSPALSLQVVSPDELFYEILIRQRAERAKFLTVLDSEEKQTPVLASSPSADDLMRVMRVQHTGSRQLDQIGARVADTLQEMKLNQVGSPKSYRLLQEGVIDPLRALNAGKLNALRGALRSLAEQGPKPGADRESVRKTHAEVVETMKNILEQMSQWESFVDVVNQVAEVIKMEQKVLQATEKARESRTQEVFDAKP